MEVIKRIRGRFFARPIIFLQARLLSQEQLEFFPYKFGNDRRKLVKARPTSDPVNLSAFKYMLKENKLSLEVGYSYAYLALLKAVAERDLGGLRQYCERNVYREFEESFSDLTKDVERIELLNEDQFPENVTIDFVDFQQIFGASIDRDTNISNKVGKMSYVKERPNFSYFMPATPEYGMKLSINIDVLVKVKTNLKLNLVDKKGASLIQKEDRQKPEYHFVRFESEVVRLPIQVSSIWKTIKKMREMTHNIEFKEWVITDIDNCLNGNPHIQE